MKKLNEIFFKRKKLTFFLISKTYFYDRFLKQGWPFFYKIVLSFLKTEEKKLMTCPEDEILLYLLENNYRNKKPKEFWRNLMRNAEKIYISAGVVRGLHLNFDCESKMFRLL